MSKIRRSDNVEWEVQKCLFRPPALAFVARGFDFYIKERKGQTRK